MPTIQFHNNGTTTVFSDTTEIIYGLNQPWITLFAQYLEAQGTDPADYKLILPNNKHAQFFNSPDGWYWEIIEK